MNQYLNYQKPMCEFLKTKTEKKPANSSDSQILNELKKWINLKKENNVNA